ncbi:hypothetical protein C7382_10241 [Porphyromonas loveana]|uniref:Uncharacterized protein n=1 Tax=Porphyromonas loveana TaxID=1884669 RepID=A0A2U1FPB5_9PORP|nr:hypothetical protein C7382_10241 [Porphyromonas loveana]
MILSEPSVLISFLAHKKKGDKLHELTRKEPQK